MSVPCRGGRVYINERRVGIKPALDFLQFSAPWHVDPGASPHHAQAAARHPQVERWSLPARRLSLLHHTTSSYRVFA